MLHGIKQIRNHLLAAPVAVMGVIIPDNHVGQSPVLSHHVGVGDETHPRELFSILDGQVAEVGDARYFVGNMVGADGEDNKSFAVVIQASSGPFVEIYNVVWPLGYAGLHQSVGIHMLSNTTHLLDPTDIISANGNDEDVQARPVIGILVILGKLWGQMVKLPGNCFGMGVEFPVNHATGDNAGRINVLKHRVPNEVSPWGFWGLILQLVHLGRGAPDIVIGSG